MNASGTVGAQRLRMGSGPRAPNSHRIPQKKVPGSVGERWPGGFQFTNQPKPCKERISKVINTPKRSAAQENKFREHYVWQERVLARADLKPAVKNVALRLALYRNIKDGTCNPSYATLAAGAAVSERTAMRAVAQLERMGLVVVERSTGGSRANTNNFRLLKAAEGVTRESPQGVTKTAARGDRAGRGGVTELCHPNTEENMGASYRGPNMCERDDELSLVDNDTGGGERLDGAPPEDSEERGLAREEDSYSELRAVWTRPWIEDEDADRRAYAAAIKKGAVPDEILEGARAWVEAANAPRFLKPLAVWLDREGWRKPPPVRRAMASGSHAGRNGWRKPDACKVVLGMVGYVEDANGRMVRQ
jgi:hypothetical protein